MDKADVMFSEKIELHFKQVERSTDLAVATIDVRFNSLKEKTWYLSKRQQQNWRGG